MKIVLSDTTFTERKLELEGGCVIGSIELKIIKDDCEATIRVNKNELIKACQAL